MAVDRDITISCQKCRQQYSWYCWSNFNNGVQNCPSCKYEWDNMGTEPFKMAPNSIPFYSEWCGFAPICKTCPQYAKCVTITTQ